MDGITLEEKAIDQRAELYLFLARSFGEPDVSLKEDAVRLSPVIDSFFPSLIEWYRDVVEAVARALDDPDSLLVAYSALFIGPFETIAPPYASIYLDSGILMGETTLTVENCYASIGMEIDPEDFPGNLPDHISAELAFLHYCLVRYNDTGDESYYRLGYAFIDSHLMKWVPEFTRRIEDGSPHPFYKNLALFLKQFLEKDKENFLLEHK